MSLQVPEGCVMAQGLSATSTNTLTPVPNSVMDLAQTRNGNASYEVLATTNDVNASIDISNDNENWINDAASTATVNAASSGMIMLTVSEATLFSRFVRLSIVDAVSGDHGNITATGYGQ